MPRFVSFGAYNGLFVNIKTGGNGEYFYLDYYIPKNKKIAANQDKLAHSVKYSDLMLQ